MNKQTHGIKSPGQLADGMATRVCNTSGAMKSASVQPKIRHSVTGSGGGRGGKKSTRY